MSKAPTRPKAKAPLSGSTDEWIGQWFTYLDSRLTAIFTALGTLTSEEKMADQALTDLQNVVTQLTTAVAAIATELQTLVTQLGNVASDPAIESQVGLIQAQVTALNAAVTAAQSPPSGS